MGIQKNAIIKFTYTEEYCANKFILLLMV